jgi:hypothetical protein
VAQRFADQLEAAVARYGSRAQRQASGAPPRVATPPRCSPTSWARIAKRQPGIAAAVQSRARILER